MQCDKELILIVDDNHVNRTMLGAQLTEFGYDVGVVQSGDSALDFLKHNEPKLILLDIMMPHMNGFETCEKIKKEPNTKHIPVIFITAKTATEDIVKAFEVGGVDYITKPFNSSELHARVRTHIEMNHLKEENEILQNSLVKHSLKNADNFSAIVTRNEGMLSLFQYIERISVSDNPVLVTGETGTGKELIADAIHKSSGRKGKLVAVNVAGLDDTMVSSALFGHLKGAFTGAVSNRKGLVAEAENGTLFLDEIGDLSLSSQIKLLRLIEAREYFPVGSDRAERTNAKVVVATHCDISDNSIFREDLYYRLKTHVVEIPPLRERPDDIRPLVHFFAEQEMAKLERGRPHIQNSIFNLIEEYSFPGNVRELKAIVHDVITNSDSLHLPVAPFEKYVLGQSKKEQESKVTGKLGNPLLKVGEFPTMKEVQAMAYEAALQKTGGNRSQAARILGVSRSSIKKYLAEKNTLE